MRFLPHLIKPDFLTVANKSLTKNAENLYFSRILTLPRLLHTQEVHGSSPCVSTMKKALAFASAFFNEINPFRDLWNALRAWNTPAACEIAAAVRIYFISLDAKHQISQFTQWIISRRARRDISPTKIADKNPEPIFDSGLFFALLIILQMFCVCCPRDIRIVRMSRRLL